MDRCLFIQCIALCQHHCRVVYHARFAANGFLVLEPIPARKSFIRTYTLAVLDFVWHQCRTVHYEQSAWCVSLGRFFLIYCNTKTCFIKTAAALCFLTSYSPSRKPHSNLEYQPSF